MYLARQALSGTALRLYALVVLAMGLLRTVSIGDVIANMPAQGLLALYDFVAAAALHTEFAVQFMLMGVTVVGLWLTRDVVRSIMHVSLMRHPL